MTGTQKVVVWDVDPPNELVAPLRRLLGTPRPWPGDTVSCPLEICAARGADGACLLQSEVDLVIVVSDHHALEMTQRLLSPLAGAASNPPILAVIKDGSSQDVVSLLERGATDFLVSPFKSDEFLPRVWRLLQTRRNGTTPVEQACLPATRLLGRNPRFTSEVAKIPLIANCDASVLIHGETGTGKELFAHAIHDTGPRAGKPFVPLNCAAIPVELAESELFGHERGAFTGAHAAQAGVIREADGGTLFLDEVPSLPLLVQAKLLRFLQEKEYRPLGGKSFRTADVRVIAATNIDLSGAVARGAFRRDLYYRLNVLPVTLIPLRERRDDIPLLSSAFVERVSQRLGRPLSQLSACAVDKLMRHEWPGNVRELEHVLERSLVFSIAPTITAADIALAGAPDAKPPRSFREAKAQTISLFEKSYIESLLAAHEGNITRAAQVAGKNRRAFWELIRKHRIVADTFRAADSHSHPDNSTPV